MEEKIKVTIDGKKCAAKRGQTILEVAKENGIWIPTLCYDERLEPYGACRLCLVEVKGARGLLPSCTTAISPDMVIRTQSRRLNSIRKTIIELLLSDHPSDCMTCESTGSCVLQDLAYHYGVKETPYKGESRSYSIIDDNPLIDRDPSKCVLCGRCVRICEEIVGAGVYAFVARGFKGVVSTPYDRSLEESPCLFCGQCISTCPVGALTSKLSKGAGRPWELEKTETTCSYCGVGCTINLWTRDNQVVKVDAPIGKGVNKGNLCVKGRFGFEFIGSPERLKY
ncbi:MAG: 2Fe-2S iron-sulfur cluster-binding protein, partial [Actinomycetota bacterium]|nr:2Fe-2S iron-sulfur cluster-binding protein [Actinomycetota bacterium]